MEIPDYTGSCIYIIWNNITNNYYIGSAKNYRQRILKHLAKLRIGKHHSWKLQRDWNKYNWWETFPLLLCSVKHLISNEQWCLDIQRPYYNICETAGSTLGRKRTPEEKARIVSYMSSRPKTHNMNISMALKNNLIFIEKCKSKCKELAESNKIRLKVVNTITGEEEEYDSISEASKSLKINKSSIQFRLSGVIKNSTYKNYTFYKCPKKY